MDSLLNNTSPEKVVVLYFQVHQPRRLSGFRFFDIGTGNNCFDDELDREVITRVATECYLPANTLLMHLIRRYPNIRITFSLSGVFIEQLEAFAPAALQSFRDLASTGAVEFLSETYYHSLACMLPGKEFEEQVLKHTETLYSYFGVRASAFRNTELIYNDDLGHRVSKLGFAGCLIDGIEQIPEMNNPNHVYEHPDDGLFRLLPRNYRLSDDIGFRFIDQGRTLTVEKYLNRIDRACAPGDVVTIGLDYETFGEHRKRNTGIIEFFEELLTRIATSPTLTMATASVAMVQQPSSGPVSIPHYISWADNERDLSAWLGNEMQRDAFDSLRALEYEVKNLGDNRLLSEWRNLQISDHLYYMSTKKGSDGTVHSYFSPYSSPYEAFINYMNVMTDFSSRVRMAAAGNAAVADVLESRTNIDHVPRMTMLAERM